MIQAKNDVQSARDQEIDPPNKYEYYYQLALAYFEGQRYDKAYNYCNQIRGYKDTYSIILKLSKLLPGLDIDPGVGRIVKSLISCKSANEMIKTLEASEIPHESFSYKKVMETLEERAKDEQINGINQRENVLALQRIK